MSNERVRAHRRLALLAFVAFLIRLGFGLLYWTDKPLTHDEREYLALAANISAGRGFVYEGAGDVGTGQRFGRVPAYPLFLAALGAGTLEPTSTPTRVKVVQSGVGAIVVWLIGIWALRAGGPQSSLVAATIAVLYPPLVWMPAYVLSETLYSAVALSCALTLQSAVDRSCQPDHRRVGGPLALAAGALVGVGTLIRPAMLVFLPLACVWLVAARRAVLAVAVIAGAVAVVSPWTARNYHEYGRLVLVASEGGVTFWTGNNPLASGEGDLAANPDLKRAELEFRNSHAGLSAEELEPIYYREAFRYIREQPGAWLRLLARKAFYLVVPTGPSYALHSARYRIASVGSYLLLLPLAAAGVQRLRSAPRRPTALYLLGGSAVLVCLVFFPQERFRIPVIDPVLIVCVGGLGRARS